MVKNKKFPKERPAKRPYDDTFGKLFPETSPKEDPIDPVPPVPDPDDPAPPEPPSPAPIRPSAPYNMRDVPGVDPDNTTDSKLIEAYAFISSAERNTLGIQHRNAYKLYNARRYKDAFEAFTKLAGDYPGNYLSAYWAGMSASKLRSYKEAIKWFDRALEVNPNYRPAINGKAGAEASGSKNNKKK
jgi:TolA-binding protein